MRTFEAPIVYLVSRPSLCKEAVARILRDEYGLEGLDAWRRVGSPTDAELLVEFAGRMCYGSFGRRQGRIGTDAYVGNILDHGHGSVTEHACFSFLLARAGRGTTHQVVRHRAGWAYSQESSHFVKYDDVDVEARACLTGLEPGSASHDLAKTAFAEAIDRYNQLWTMVQADLGTGKKATCAVVRGLLPTALESRLAFTANARALRWFVELRGAPDNVVEIRHVAAQVAGIMREEMPSTFSDVAVGVGDDGIPVVSVGRRKV